MMDAQEEAPKPVLDPLPSGTARLGVSQETMRDVRSGVAILERYARCTGKQIPEAARSALAKLEISSDGPETLALALDVHNQLAAIAAPATVRSLTATDPDQGWVKWCAHLWIVPIAFALTIVALVGFIWRSGVLDGRSTAKTEVQVQSFLSLGASTAWAAPGDEADANAKRTPAKMFPHDQMLFLCAAALGAAFYALFTAYGYIADRTFDPSYNTVYLVRLLLGITSGFILANFLPASATQGYAPSLLALIGGYSADAVNQVLKRLTDTFLTA